MSADSDDFALDGSDYQPDEPNGAAVVAEEPEVAEPEAGYEVDAVKAMKGMLFFDLETVPDESRMASFDLPPLREVPTAAAEGDCPNPTELLKGTVKDIETTLEKLVPPDAYLDQLAKLEKELKGRDGVFKVLAATRSIRGDVMQEHADRLTLLSTTPEYCAIASMAAVIGGDAPIRCSAVGNKNSGGIVTERLILQLFWDMVSASRVVVGYHICGFDLPVIFFRSALLGIKPSRILDLTPWKNDCLDLYAKRFPRGAPNNAGKLKQQAKLMGIKVPAGDVEGSQVYELFKAKRFAELEAYNTSDVAILRDYYLKFRGMYWK